MSQNFEQLAGWLTSQGPQSANRPKDDRQWRALADAICRAGLAGIVLEQARRRGDRLCPEFTAPLQRDATIVAAHNLNAKVELERVVEALDRAGVEVMLLKGAALEAILYERPDLRPMSDVDLLVRPADASAACAALEACDCRRGQNLIRDDFFPSYHYELEFITRSIKPVRIDLHARPFRPLRIARIMPDDALRHGAKPVEVGKTTAVIPRLEFMLIHLAAHAAFHGCSRLIWLYDIKRFVDRFGSKMDWSMVIESARAWGLLWPVRVAIDRVEEHFGAILPRDVRARLSAHRPGWVDRLMVRRAASDATSPIAHVAFNVLFSKGIGFRLGYLWSLAVPSRKHLADVYPHRHPGWVPTAHAWRVLRTLSRAVAAPRRATGRLTDRLARSHRATKKRIAPAPARS